MVYKILADSVVILHFAFIVFALLGGLLILWRNWFIFIHLPAALWSAIVEFNGWICPLTPLENQFLNLSGRSNYQGGFVDYYLLPIIYPAGLTRQDQVILGFLAILVNFCIYAFVYWRKRKVRHSKLKGIKP